MALDLVTASFPDESQPKKRARLGWDDPDPAFLAEATRLQFQIAAQLLMVRKLLSICLSTAILHHRITVLFLFKITILFNYLGYAVRVDPWNSSFVKISVLAVEIGLDLCLGI